MLYQKNNTKRSLFIKSLFLHNLYLKPFCGLSKFESFMFNFSAFLLTLFSTIIINALFITDSQLSKKFKQHLMFTDHFLRGLYSSLILIVISKIIRDLTRYYSVLAVVLQENSESKNIKRICKRFTSVIKKKILLFYIIDLVISIVFGLYLTTFLNVYSHTITPLIISSLISILLSIVYSICICLALLLTTYYGIKYELLFVYKISLFLQYVLIN